MQNKKFIIPEFQRPYKWDEEKCETLWMDIVTFNDNKMDDEEYFLGTIVSNKYNTGVEIIDGQQRITTFLLLLRAFYSKLEKMVEDDNVRGLKNQIGPCIWDIDPISQKVSDKTKLHIESLAATDEDKKTFHLILETGETPDGASDFYSLNYNFFLEKCDEFAKNYPMAWQPLCVTILHKCIVLPIECNNQDTALTIFSTLNDRGLPLSDSDIFKAQIYKIKPEDERPQFTELWKELMYTCDDANLSLEDIFRYYSHILRAKGNDKSKEIGLRKYYSSENYKKLTNPELLNDLSILSDFWLYVNSGKKKDSLNFDLNFESKKYLHCLSCYPNDFWKYITSVYFFKNKDNEKFIEIFQAFLEKLTAFLFYKFIQKPTVNAIKDDIYAGCIAVFNNESPNFSVSIQKENELKERIGSFFSSRLTRALILLHTYMNENQKEIVPETFDIEHIFPKKWQNTNYNGWENNEAVYYLDKFGNKVAIEKKLNIQAGNNYFGNKKNKYAKSSIESVKQLAFYPKDDWNKEDIENREKDFLSDIVSFFKKNLA
jgi:uncharacterized protein with ParB-like and HNH nuclease domain